MFYSNTFSPSHHPKNGYSEESAQKYSKHKKTPLTCGRYIGFVTKAPISVVKIMFFELKLRPLRHKLTENIYGKII
jgi:hypothetical protein